MGLGQVFAIRSIAFHQIRDCIETYRVDAHVQPVAQDFQDFFHHARIVEIQIRLMREEPMPVICLGHRVPAPVGLFRIGEDNASILVFLWRIAPDVELALFGTTGRRSRRLEPGMLIGRVIDYQLYQDLKIAVVSGVHKSLKVVYRSIAGMYVQIIRNVVAIVLERRRKEWQ